MLREITTTLSRVKSIADTLGKFRWLAPLVPGAGAVSALVSAATAAINAAAALFKTVCDGLAVIFGSSSAIIAALLLMLAGNYYGENTIKTRELSACEIRADKLEATVSTLKSENATLRKRRGCPAPASKQTSDHGGFKWPF